MFLARLSGTLDFGVSSSRSFEIWFLASTLSNMHQECEPSLPGEAFRPETLFRNLELRIPRIPQLLILAPSRLLARLPGVGSLPQPGLLQCMT